LKIAVTVRPSDRPPVRDAAVEAELHVAGALELLEDHFVHLGAGVDQRGREDRQ